MPNWLSKLFARRNTDDAPEKLYTAVMAAALQERLYLNGLAEDTFDGRFEALTLHSALLLRALREFGEPGKKLADQLYRRVFAGIDHALRERGAGDSSIARKVRGYGERFFGLARAVDAALEAEDRSAELHIVMVRNEIGGGSTSELVRYLLESEEKISQMSLSALQSAALDWPEV